MEKDDVITLYPGNWLYNAGVIGLLRSVEEVEKLPLDCCFNFYDDGSLSVKKIIFNELDVERRYFSEEEKISSIVGKSNLYRNYLQPSWISSFPYFVKNLSKIKENDVSFYCNLCYRRFALPNSEVEDLKSRGLKKFLESIKKFDIRHNAILGPSLGEFPNSFWNNNQSLYICPLCAFLIIHHHLALTRLRNGSEIFINTPSFEIMWHLNKYARQIFEKENVATTKELLGMSLIEMVLKLNIQLGKWTIMNIEVVSKYKIDNKDRIDFFSLPYEIVYLLSDREIASLLNDIGEFNVLNMVLNSNFKGILEFAERIFRIALKSEREKQENKFINDNVKLERNKGNNLIAFSQKLFKLYTLIEEKVIRRFLYE
ncbi:type I-B CRISPR-associated protein Cas8b1/Cst1 [Thermovenabulum gondwanense]|uniref:CRISPR-associated protein CXXC-CXXC domain-containing protein n=1 Tax=Thermovenabulum gondwanense TaxID=520767 RepID=A0A161QCZ8_9FIRM|nr:type I-B CRISPR-associated protein Cas8b1/Cst1 [Thermovenabulum gondwanense]KYO67334.1 hypothetical protein ATZ99_06200 [Thermovenabulum gondwanense]